MSQTHDRTNPAPMANSANVEREETAAPTLHPAWPAILLELQPATVDPSGDGIDLRNRLMVALASGYPTPDRRPSSPTFHAVAAALGAVLDHTTELADDQAHDLAMAVHTLWERLRRAGAVHRRSFTWALEGIIAHCSDTDPPRELTYMARVEQRAAARLDGELRKSLATVQARKVTDAAGRALEQCLELRDCANCELDAEAIEELGEVWQEGQRAMRAAWHALSELEWLHRDVKPANGARVTE